MLNEILNSFKDNIDRLSLDEELKHFTVTELDKINLESQTLSYLYTSIDDPYIKELQRTNKGQIEILEYTPISLLKLKTPLAIISIDKEIDLVRLRKYIPLIKCKEIIVFSKNEGINLDHKKVIVHRNKTSALVDMLKNSKFHDEIFNFTASRKALINSYVQLLKSKILSFKQNIDLLLLESGQEKAITASNERVTKDNSFNKRLDKQDEILKKIIAKTLEDGFNQESQKLINLKEGAKGFDSFKESAKGKKLLLQYPENWIEHVNTHMDNIYSEIWRKILTIVSDYQTRYSSILTEYLAKKSLQNNFNINFPYGEDEYLNFSKKSVKSPFTSFRQEISKRRIGEYLMKARMLPMYILMGASMMGVGINQYRKYFGPVIIFIMGLGFYMVYRSKEKEEKFEREKAKDYLSEKAVDEIEKRSKEFNSLVSKAVDDFQKTLKTSTKSYYELHSSGGSKSGRASGIPSNDNSSILSKKISELKFLNSAIEKLELKLNRVN